MKQKILIISEEEFIKMFEKIWQQKIEKERMRIETQVQKVIIDKYNEAKRLYQRAKDKNEIWARNDAISENSKMVAYSRIEPELRKAINLI